MWISLEQIEYLREINRAGSITQAAEKLRRSKSALTKAIQNLEEQVGFEILDRSEYRVRLTDRGQSFLQKAGVVLKSVNDLKEACEQISTQVETRITLSIASPFDSRKIYPVIKKAAALFKGTQIILHRETLSGEKMLKEELVDIAIIEGLRSRRELDVEPLGEIEFILVIAPDHPFFVGKGRTIRDLYPFPQIIQTSSLAREEISYGVHKEAVKWFVSDISSKKEIIVNGLGWGRLPRHVVEKELACGKLFHLKEPHDDDVIDVYLAKRKGMTLGKVGTFFWEQFAALK